MVNLRNPRNIFDGTHQERKLGHTKIYMEK